MKNRGPILFLLPILSSCNPFSIVVGNSDSFLNETFKKNIIFNFDGSKEEKDQLSIRNGYTNGGMFLSYWNKNNVAFQDDMARLSLFDSENKNYGAEIRTNQGYQYGYFGARIKTFKKEGTVQSLFTYNGGEFPHDEIDIEFLGKDTTKVQFNYFHNGIGNHEYLYNLGFDSSLEFHDYGFKWEKDKITWFIDFKAVYQVKASLPQWGFLYINVWAGNPENSTAKKWLGTYEKSNETFTAYYDYLSYSSL